YAGRTIQTWAVRSNSSTRKVYQKEKETQEDVINVPNDNLQVPRTSKRMKSDFLSSFIPTTGESDEHPIEDEIEEYLKENRCTRDSDPLEFYRKQADIGKYPILCRLAKKYLGFPASSSSIERVFSIMGSLNRARRARLTTKTMEDFLIYREFRRIELGM
ncbi:unnamed protein product, partial [Allacma fusca]